MASMDDSGSSEALVDGADNPDADGDNKKICVSCGKDLRGHRRFKDSEGYWCKDCHRVDLKRKTVPEGRCPDCGRMRPLDKLFQMDDGTQVCSACRKERLAKAEKYAVQAMAVEEEQASERRKILLFFGILVAAGLILLWSLLRKYFHH